MNAFIIQVARTIIAPKGGALKHHSVHALAASAIRALLAQSGLNAAQVNQVILGNALAAGGNVARAAALAALPQQVPAITVDTQCCSGMDAIALAADRIRAGQASVIVAGGVESFSQAPLRARRLIGAEATSAAADLKATPAASSLMDSTNDSLLRPDELVYRSQRYQVFEQARFTPWADRDPGMLDSAIAFAAHWRVPQSRQEAFAIESHRRALAHQSRDPYSRRLTPQICARLPPLAAADLLPSILAKENPYAITAATMAVEADAAALVLVVSEKIARRFPWAVEVLAHASVGGDPLLPAGAGTLAASHALAKVGLRSRMQIASQIACAEIMESFAAQTLVTMDQLGLDPAKVNRSGGMLARGHPIGASGAVLVGNLFLELQQPPLGNGALGLAAIPAAGGLGSAMILRR
jgi:acetyl-CoA C-acetyltransferase